MIKIFHFKILERSSKLWPKKSRLGVSATFVLVGEISLKPSGHTATRAFLLSSFYHRTLIDRISS